MAATFHASKQLISSQFPPSHDWQPHLCHACWPPHVLQQGERRVCWKRFYRRILVRSSSICLELTRDKTLSFLSILRDPSCQRYGSFPLNYFEGNNDPSQGNLTLSFRPSWCNIMGRQTILIRCACSRKTLLLLSEEEALNVIVLMQVMQKSTQEAVDQARNNSCLVR